MLSRYPNKSGAMTTNLEPAEVKAQAIVRMCLGHSARCTERELKAMYPDVHIPHYSTLSRYLVSCRRPRGKRSNVYRWGTVAARVAEILYNRIDELVTADPRQLVKSYKTIMAVYDATVAGDK